MNPRIKEMRMCNRECWSAPSVVSIRTISQTGLMLLLVASAIPNSTDAVETPKTEKASQLDSTIIRFANEIEAIRIELGAPQNTSSVKVQNVSPFELYAQSLLIFDKSNQLSFEWNKTRGVRPAPLHREIRFDDVCQVIDACQARIELVKQRLGIEESAAHRKTSPTATPTQMFENLVGASRQLNLLLADPVEAADVYAQTTLAINLTILLLQHYPNAQRIAAEPAYERRKTSRDVRKELTRCQSLLQKISDDSGVLLMRVQAERDDTVSTSDLYDTASLIVAELQQLNKQRTGQTAPFEAFYPGRKTLSELFQRTALLRLQLNEILRCTQESSAHSPNTIQGTE